MEKYIATPKDFEIVASRLEELKYAEPDTDEAKELKHLMKLLINYLLRNELFAKVKGRSSEGQ